MEKCKEGEHEYYYYPEINEQGWKCSSCDDCPGEPPGFSPHLDRKEIWIKVGSILMDATAANLVSVSNGSCGDYLTSKVADRCVRENVFDQYSILKYLMEEMTPSHADYWKEVSDGIIAGADPRDRCHCGKLSTRSVYRDGQSAHYCSDACEPQWAREPF